MVYHYRGQHEPWAPLVVSILEEQLGAREQEYVNLSYNPDISAWKLAAALKTQEGLQSAVESVEQLARRKFNLSLDSMKPTGAGPSMKTILMNP